MNFVANAHKNAFALSNNVLIINIRSQSRVQQNHSKVLQRQNFFHIFANKKDYVYEEESDMLFPTIP